MKRNGRKTRCRALLLAMGTVLLLSACGGSSNGGYDTYATAYQRVFSNGGLDADLDVTLNMDGVTKTATGNFQLDDSGDKTNLYLQVNLDGETITQFSDGDYLYTDSRGEKTVYPLGAQPERGEGDDKGAEDGAPEFDTDSFLEEFASFLEVGKIKELGLFDPIPSNAATVQHSGNVYTLTVNETILTKYLNSMTDSVTVGGSDSVKVSNLKDFTYEATVENDYVTQVDYGGNMTVTVPGTVSGTGAEESYDLEFSIDVKFNNPGSAVSIAIPSTDGYV